MSFDRLKKIQTSAVQSDEPKGPYTDLINKISSIKSNKTEGNGDGEVESFKQNSYFISKCTLLERENKELKQDIVSLYIMMMGIETDEMTDEDIRALYTEFKKDKRHLVNRQWKK